MKHNYILSAAIALGLAASASATIAISLDGEVLQDHLGNPLPTNTMFLLIASTGDLTFSSIQGGAGTAVGSTLTPGGDDYVVGRGDLSGFGEPGVLSTFLTGVYDSPLIGGGTVWGAGDPLALVWLPGLTLGSTTISNGNRYGIYTRNTAFNGTDAWISPTEPNPVNLGLYTTNGSTLLGGPGLSPASAGLASQTAVPEPSTLGMAALGVIGLMSRRRRN